jgi:hypothetical protein
VLALKGNVTQGPAQETAEKFLKLTGTNPFIFVADLRELVTYTPEVRRTWQDSLFKVRDQIREIYVVGARNPLVRMVASAVALFVGTKITFVEQLSEVPNTPFGSGSK